MKNERDGHWGWAVSFTNGPEPWEGQMPQHVSEDFAASKPRDLFDPTTRIVALLRMLGNGASDTEIIGAAKALERTLEGAGGLHGLADFVDANWRPPAPAPDHPAPPPPAPKYDWQILADRLLRYPELLIVSDRIDEVDFLHNMRKSRACPSDKQWKWMGDIEARLPPEQRMAS
jgi:hypothetical protein